ncbi:hypothetical protein GK047_07955 [Paenibacillus sp. SYP-B3998]|uniref:Uncharacterized protein n=2 Tax=Paenibacillus sp. SYP-B3998 TaxID=2678564 RepID=A0A6G3ZWJ1_9BACL|nr:hypothetical protein [Paenibacillus sp. SYP-B3998]
MADVIFTLLEDELTRFEERILSENYASFDKKENLKIAIIEKESELSKVKKALLNAKIMKERDSSKQVIHRIDYIRDDKDNLSITFSFH